MVRQFLRFILQHWFLSLLTLISLLCYASVWLSPAFFWPATFLSYAIPGFLILNLLLIILFGALRKRKVILPVIGFFSGIIFILITYRSHAFLAEKGNGISVLSFNAKLFRKSKTYNEFSFDMINWMVRDSSDVKCIQEYSTNNRWPELDITKKIASRGYSPFTYTAKIKGNEHNLGMAIFTRQPIVVTGVVWEDSTSLNSAIFADVKFKDDTLRVYNVHLASMGLDLGSLKNIDHYFTKVKRVIYQLKEGAIKRSYQVDQLIKHAQSCSHPFIICGDFNETPYSYNYFQLRSHFYNAFEKAGNGFGFSLNSKIFFLRIDHQFYSKDVNPLDYSVDRSMVISDHYPTRAIYQISR